MNDPAHLSDRDLFEAVTTGNAAAMAELVDRHARGLHDFALRGTLDEQQGASVVEAAFRRLRDPGTQVPVQIDFGTWLYSLCLTEVLALANEVRTARISTEDERFFRHTADVDHEVARWVWQAARGLRTRDYCVLDLTLRRGLTPEEVAEAASLTRSNLYASIGRARGAFEETFAAILLYERGRDACPELNELAENSPGDVLRPALRHQIIEHSDECDACRRTLSAMPLGADVYISLADVEMPQGLAQRIYGEAASALAPPEQEPAAEVVSDDVSGLPASSLVAAAFAEGAAVLEARSPAPADEETPGDEAEAPFQTEPVTETTPEPALESTPEPVSESSPSEPQPASEDGPGDQAASPPGIPEAPLALPSAHEPLALLSPVEGETPPPAESGPVPAPESEPILLPAASTEVPAQSPEDSIAEAEQSLDEQEPPPEKPVEEEDVWLPEVAPVVPSLLVTRDGEPVTVAPEAEPEPQRRERTRRAPSAAGSSSLSLRYAFLGVAAALVAYLGIAVADSLQSGGAGSGAVPLDTAPGMSAQREIDCGDIPIEMQEGEETLITFDEDELGGYQIQNVSFAPVSDFAQFEDLEATLENPHTLRFIARDQESAEARQEEFELRILWQKGEESASSTCQLLVNIAPDN